MRRAGKSKATDIVRDHLHAMGLKPCPLCRVDGKWDIYHTVGHPCPKESPEMRVISIDEASDNGGESA